MQYARLDSPDGLSKRPRIHPMLPVTAGEYGPAAKRTERPVRHLGDTSIDRRSRRIGLASATALIVGALMAVSLGTGGSARAAGGSVDLDQWATIDAAWQNGNLNGNNTAYPEGGVVPFRLAVEGLSAGNHSIRISYDFTAGGHKAYDFLSSWNAWRSPNLCGGGGGAVSSLCPGLGAASTAGLPSDSFKTDGLSVAGAQAYSTFSRRMTIYGGSITSISAPVHSGSASGNSTAEITVRFTSKGSAVLLAWGGHLAQSGYWDVYAGGAPDGAGQVSGAPWHMRTLQLDGAGNRNQDRSIQASAISGALAGPTPPAAPAPTPKPTQNTSVVVPPAGGNDPPPQGGSAPRPTVNPNITLPPTSALPAGSLPSSNAPELLTILVLALFASMVILQIARDAKRYRRH